MGRVWEYCGRSDLENCLFRRLVRSVESGNGVIKNIVEGVEEGEELDAEFVVKNNVEGARRMDGRVGRRKKAMIASDHAGPG